MRLPSMQARRGPGDGARARGPLFSGAPGPERLVGKRLESEVVKELAVADHLERVDALGVEQVGQVLAGGGCLRGSPGRRRARAGSRHVPQQVGRGSGRPQVSRRRRPRLLQADAAKLVTLLVERTHLLTHTR